MHSTALHNASLRTGSPPSYVILCYFMLSYVISIISFLLFRLYLFDHIFPEVGSAQKSLLQHHQFTYLGTTSLTLQLHKTLYKELYSSLRIISTAAMRKWALYNILESPSCSVKIRHGRRRKAQGCLMCEWAVMMVLRYVNWYGFLERTLDTKVDESELALLSMLVLDMYVWVGWISIMDLSMQRTTNPP